MRGEKTDLRTYYNIILDCWKLLKEYYGITQADESKWTDLLERAEEIYQKYNRCNLAKKSVLLIIGELEEQSKK